MIFSTWKFAPYNLLAVYVPSFNGSLTIIFESLSFQPSTNANLILQFAMRFYFNANGVVENLFTNGV
jgi:hypothetical protein